MILPKSDGYYQIDRYKIMFNHKPNFIHRFFVRVFFGLVWKDGEI